MTQKVGVVGLGNMGGRMARRLVDAGNDVLGFDLSPAAAKKARVPIASSIPEVTSRSEHVLLSLPGTQAVEQAVLGDDGILNNARAGQIVVDLSTSAPASTRMVHTRMAEIGVEFLDAGVSGGAPAAEEGRLTLMVGGSPGALERIETVLSQLASRIFRMGGPGSGHSTKLLNNFLNAVNLAASSEVMVAAKKAGLDVARVLDVINNSSGENWATRNRFPSIIRGDYLEGGLTSQLMMKDLELYLQHLVDIGVPSLNASGPIAMFGLALQRGYGAEISNRVVDALGELAGGVRLQNDED